MTKIPFLKRQSSRTELTLKRGVLKLSSHEKKYIKLWLKENPHPKLSVLDNLLSFTIQALTPICPKLENKYSTEQLKNDMTQMISNIYAAVICQSIGKPIPEDPIISSQATAMIIKDRIEKQIINLESNIHDQKISSLSPSTDQKINHKMWYSKAFSKPEQKQLIEDLKFAKKQREILTTLFNSKFNAKKGLPKIINKLVQKKLAFSSISSIAYFPHKKMDNASIKLLYNFLDKMLSKQQIFTEEKQLIHNINQKIIKADSKIALDAIKMDLGKMQTDPKQKHSPFVNYWVNKSIRDLDQLNMWEEDKINLRISEFDEPKTLQFEKKFLTFVEHTLRKKQKNTTEQWKVKQPYEEKIEKAKDQLFSLIDYQKKETLFLQDIAKKLVQKKASSQRIITMIYQTIKDAYDTFTTNFVNNYTLKATSNLDSDCHYSAWEFCERIEHLVYAIDLIEETALRQQIKNLPRLLINKIEEKNSNKSSCKTNSEAFLPKFKNSFF